MGSVTFTNTYTISGIGSTTTNIQINYSESYDAATNKTTVSLTSIKQSASRNFGSPVVRGAVQFNGTTVVSYPDNSSSYYVSLSSGNTSTYNAWTSKTASTKVISHGTDGKANLTIKLVDTNSSGYFGAWYNSKAVGVPANSEQTVALTTHAYTLTTAVTPSGYGTVTTGGSLAPTATKSLTATPTSQTAQYKYAFSKWTKTAGTLSSTTTNPTTFTMGTAAATVTANFTRSTRSYTVTCKDYVGSTSGTLLGTSTASYAYGTSVSGATFGSNTTSDAYYTGYHYSSSSSATTVSGATTVYRYFAIDSYTLTTARNINSYGTVTAGATLNYHATKSLTATPTALAGYSTVFSIWTVSGTGSSLSSTTANPTTFTMGNANATVTAIFTRTGNTYYVKFNGNGSTSGSMSDETFTYGASAKALTTNAFAKTGYTFSGWNTKADGSGTSYADKEKVSNLTTTAGATVNLYAQWTIITYTVSYSSNGRGSNPASQTKTYGVNLTLRAFLSAQQESGTPSNYVVTGNANGGVWTGSNGSATKTLVTTFTQSSWNTSSDGSGTSYSSQQTYTANAALSLFAIWNSSSAYSYSYVLPSGDPTNTQNVTVTFNPNGGTTSKASEDGIRDMSFNGWWTAPTGGTQRTTSSTISADETVYAHYADGTSSYSSVTLPTSLQCTKNGFTLVGWDTSSSATTAVYQPGASYTPTADVTLYAVWRGNGTVRIDNETSFSTYYIYIDNGSSWDQYAAYIDNGNTWDPYS